MSVYDRNKFETFQGMLGLLAMIKTMQKLDDLHINRNIQIHVASICILQQTAILKGNNTLFKELVQTEEMLELTHTLVEKITTLCEEHLSDMLEMSNK